MSYPPRIAYSASTPGGATLAWVRFEDAPQEYKGTKYFFLGDGALELTIDVKPQAGQKLALLWGSKKDARQAALTINGVNVPLRSKSGVDGFTWLEVKIPEEAVKGADYKVTLEAPAAGAVRPTFLGEIRLMAGEAQRTIASDLKAPASKITLKRTPRTARASGGYNTVDSAHYLWNEPRFNGEAFPEMRKLWDREPAAVGSESPQDALFRQAERNGRQAAEAFYRCKRFVEGWLPYADKTTGLIPRNLNVSADFWNGRDSAADNYPFMVLTSWFTDRALFEGRMLDILKTEIRLTSRLDRLGDDYSFSRRGWRRPEVQLDEIIFDNSEYVKDGIMPLTEWLGASVWSERGIGLIEDVWKHATIETPNGKIPTLNFEVNGDLLQACSRLYWFTGERKYLDWAVRLGDYYLLGDHHPMRDMDKLSLSDHACEVFNGLSELYVAVSKAEPKKAEAYRKPLCEIYDRILEIGRDEHGLLYTNINPKTGEHDKVLTDCWGYNYDGIYTMYLMDGNTKYRDAVRQALGSLKEHYTGHAWQGGSADGYADSIEGAINLYNREPVDSAAEWIDSETKVMWSKQHPDGVIEGWHGDGNFARTSIMYALWKTQGVSIQPWREDVRVGAVETRDGKGIVISLAADKAWTGKVIFDKPRHKVNMKLPLDYPRINQFAEWYTAEGEKEYRITEEGKDPKDLKDEKDLKGAKGERDGARKNGKAMSGKAMQEGVAVTLKAGEELRWLVDIIQ